MSMIRRVAWLLERRREWCGFSALEAVEGCLSPRVEHLIIEMREAGLFPDLWEEALVIRVFVTAVAEARAAHRRSYKDAVRRSEHEDA